MSSGTRRNLPNGVVPFQQISDVRVRDVLMKMNENVVSLKRQVDALANKITELERRR